MRTKTNYVYKGLLRALKQSGKHVVLLHRTRDVWESTTRETPSGEVTERNKVPGVFEREGFNRTGFHVNAEVYLMFEPSRGGSLANQFGMRVTRCLQRPALATRQSDEKAFWDLSDEGWWWGREKIDGRRMRRASFEYLAGRIFGDPE
jgi:hypothetical protein